MCETKCEAKSEAISGPRLAWRLRPGYTRECIAHFPFGSYAIRESSWERDRMVLFMSWARSPVREEGHRGGNVEAAIDALKAWAQADFARRLEVSLGEVQHNAGCSINYTPSKFNPTPTCNCGATHMTDPTLTPEVNKTRQRNMKGNAVKTPHIGKKCIIRT